MIFNEKSIMQKFWLYIRVANQGDESGTDYVGRNPELKLKIKKVYNCYCNTKGKHAIPKQILYGKGHGIL